MDRSIPIAIAALVLFAAGCGPTAREDEAQIRQVFAEYKAAIVDERPDAAGALVSAASLDRFEQIRQLALHASRAELEARPAADQMLVLVLRVRSDEKGVAEMDPQQILAFLIRQKTLGAEFDSKSELDEIVLDGDQATARHAKYGQPVMKGLRFVREPAGWRQDLVTVLATNERDLERLGGGARKATLIRMRGAVELMLGEGLRPRHFEPLAAEPSVSMPAG
jgi:hypothetical protein